MKQTAVQWLVEQLQNHNGVTRNEFENVIQQAKAMEKEQIINFGKIVADKWGMIPVPLENIEDTYNETFKSE